jgi:butyrate kinase
LREVQRREDEAVETLRDEGVYTESAFLEHTDRGTFLVSYMEAEDMRQVQQSFEQSDHPIDDEHKAVMREVLVDGRDVGEYEQLYHLTHPERS